MAEYKLTCKICEKPFIAHFKNAMYCKNCQVVVVERRKAMMRATPSVVVKCKECGKDFRTKQGCRTMCRACEDKARYERQQKLKEEKRRNEPLTVTKIAWLAMKCGQSYGKFTCTHSTEQIKQLWSEWMNEYKY